LGITAAFGGGIYASGVVKLKNSTIAYNVINHQSFNPRTEGGGIFGSAELINTIISNNSAVIGPDFRGTATSLGNNLISNTSGLAVGDSLTLNPPAAGLTAGLLVNQSYVSAANQITVVFFNATGSAIDAASANWNYMFVR
jgi:hypothetical protein